MSYETNVGNTNNSLQNFNVSPHQIRVGTTLDVKVLCFKKLWFSTWKIKFILSANY